MLQSYERKIGDPNTPHDYMDDLESFFYVLCEPMFTRVSFQKQVDSAAKELLRRWDTKDENTAADSKLGFLLKPFRRKLMDADCWGSACTDLLDGFHSLLQTIAQEKLKIMNEDSTSVQEKIVQLRGMGLNGKIDEHYDSLDALFNKTLKALETEEPEIEARLKLAKANAGFKDEDSDIAPQSATPVVYSTRSSAKRASRDVEGLEANERPTKSVRVDAIAANALPFPNATLESL